MKLTVSPTGDVRFIYSDDLRPLLDAGDARISRASHVEPSGSAWTADLAPAGGPLLGPFATRAEALAAEVAWLDENLGGVRL
jgi:hypothetical protein